MKKKSYILSVFLSTIALSLSAQRPVNTQFAQSLIPVSEQVSIASVDALLASTFSLSADDDLALTTTLTDDAGFTHYKYEQKYKNLDVEGSTVTVHVLNGLVKSLSGNFRSFQQIDISPSVTKQAGLQNALNKVNAKTYIWQQDPTYAQPTGELVVFTNPIDNKTRLAYKYDVYAVEPLYRANIYVDAMNGKVLFENNRIHHADVAASGNSLYQGSVSFTADFTGSNYRLRQAASGNGVETYNLNGGSNYSNATDFTSNSSTSWSDATGIQAHWGAEKTHAYFLSKHGRNSYNGTGGAIKSYVHYSTNYVNAFWDGSRMTYGDGDGVNYSPLVSLDIVGHEIAHGVTEYSANLIYSYESGALNESFSDIFGEAIENFATGTNDWQMGTEIGIGGSGAIRSMNNPNTFGNPDTYLGTFWYTGSGDNGGVHYNSGVQNKWFYILSQGETGTNDNGSAYSVNGIGITKAANIAYRNLSVYLSSSSNYAAARAGSIQAAIDLYGAGSAEEIATTNAWYAVGVGTAYGVLSYCSSQGTNASYEWIANVSFGSFSNSSTGASYSDFTNQTVSVNAGQTYGLSLTPGFSSGSYPEHWRIWIDYNADGDFSDVGEMVYSSGSSTTMVTGSVSIPSSASGTTRMRVSMKYSASQTECETFSYGEVEDYTIDISNNGGGGDTQAPTAPTNLVSSGTTQTSTNLSWSASTDNVGVTGYEIYVGGTLNGFVNLTSYNLSGLTPATSYTISVVAKDAAGNVSSQSNLITVTTLQALDTQAPSAPSNLNASNITQTSADLFWTASADNVGVASYEIYLGGALQGTTSSTSYSLSGLTPATAYNVTVRAKDAAGNTSSQSNLVIVTTLPALDTQAPSAPGNVNASNITQTSADISWTASADNVGVVGYDISLDGSFVGSTSSTSFSLSGLSSGTAYLVTVSAKDAAGNTSNSSTNFTTLSAVTSAVLLGSYFESGLGGWIDGGSGCKLYSGNKSYEGNYSIELKDNSGTASAATSPVLNLSSYSQVEIEFYFYPSSMENGDDFWVRFYDGSSWQTVATYVSGSDFSNNTYYVATVVLSNANFNFSSNAQFRFQCDAGDSKDKIYIDAVTVTASNTVLFATPTGPKQTNTEVSTPLVLNQDFATSVKLYPNPALNLIHLEMDEEPASIRIISMNGQILRVISDTKEMTSIDVSALNPGTYILQIELENELIYERFVKQ